MFLNVKNIILLLIFANTTAHAASAVDDSAAATAGSGSSSLVSIKESSVGKVLTYGALEEAYKRSLHFMAARRDTLATRLLALDHGFSTKDETCDYIYNNFGKSIHKRYPRRPKNEYEKNQVISDFKMDLENTLSGWSGLKGFVEEIVKDEGYRPEPERNLTALDILYIGLFESTVWESMNAFKGRLPGKLTYEDVDAHIRGIEDAMCTSEEEYSEFVYKWQLARVLRPFLSPVYLGFERLNPYEGVYQDNVEGLGYARSMCKARLTNLYVYVSSVLRDMDHGCSLLKAKGYEVQEKEFLRRIAALGGLPLMKHTRFNLGHPDVKLTDVLKKRPEVMKDTATAVLKSVNTPSMKVKMTGVEKGEDTRAAILHSLTTKPMEIATEVVVHDGLRPGEKAMEYASTLDAPFWTAEEGFITTGYVEMMELLQELGTFIETNIGTAAAESVGYGAGAGAGAGAGKTVASKGITSGKKDKKKTGEKVKVKDIEDFDAILAEATRENAAAKAKADREELVRVTRRLIEDQQRAATNWREDLETYTVSLVTHTTKESASSKSYPPRLKEWVQTTVEAENLLYSRCEEQLKHRFGLYSRGGSRKGLVDKVSGAIGFFHILHPEDKFQGSDAFWRRDLKQFFIRAGLYEDRKLPVGGGAGASSES